MQLGLLLALWLAQGASARGQMATTHVVGLQLVGLQRTEPRWLEGYIDYRFPADVTTADLADLRSKLATTSVFTIVEVTLVPAPGQPGEALLQVEVQERWTLIPVVRAAYGGGTPLKVLGAYDIHAFGELLTLGGEARQYGRAPPGFVVYGRNPRGDGDRYYLGGEVWREFRRRDAIGRDGTVVGALSTNMTLSRLRLLVPFDTDERERGHHWKYGGELATTQEAPSVFDPGRDKSSVPPAGLAVNGHKRFSLALLPTLMYDDVAVDHIEYHGLRAKLRYGPIVAAGSVYSFAEGEADYFRLLRGNWNLALRAVVGQATFSSLQSEYFLGGLDTIRGLPDGAIYGTHAAYANVEMRHLSAKMHYLWLQTAAFVDSGMAARSWTEAGAGARSTAGFGIRLAVPQVYRLMLRVDYAWSLNGPHTQGVTAGINQFFDPYSPL